MARRRKTSSYNNSTVHKRITNWIVLSSLLIVLTVSISRVRQVQIWWSEAVGQPAHLVIPTQHETTELRHVWQGIGQGLEGDETMLEPVISYGQELQLQLVR